MPVAHPMSSDLALESCVVLQMEKKKKANKNSVTQQVNQPRETEREKQFRLA